MLHLRLDVSSNENQNTGLGEWTIRCAIPHPPSKPSNFSLEPLEASFFKDLVWYFEQYAFSTPFETQRATKCKMMLDTFRETLEQAILNFLASERHAIPQRSRVRVAICEDMEQGRRENFLFKIPWELLEESTQFSYKVVRIVSASTSSNTNTASSNPKSLRILLVVARSTNPEDSDVDSQIIAKPLIECLDRIRHESDLTIQIKIARPGTYKAFLDCLREGKSRGEGFDLVHFDLHGKLDETNGVVLKFLSPRTKATSEDAEVTAAQLGHILAKFEVKCTVFNACNSANVEANLASELVRKGVPMVLASSHKLHSTAAKVFMGHLYREIILHGKDVLSAAALAREALRHLPARKDRFGTFRNVFDWPSLVLYMNDVETSFRWPSTINNSGSSTQFLSGQEPLYGRQLAVLQLETDLSLSSDSVLVLTGMSGSGKTSLLKYACTWWEQTDFVRRTQIFDLSDDRFRSIESIWESITDGGLSGPGKEANTTALRALSNNHDLIVFDSFESCQPEFAKRLLVFLDEYQTLVKESLSKCYTKVIISTCSRRSIGVLKSFEHRVLDALQPSAAMQLARNCAAQHHIQLDDTLGSMANLEKVLQLLDYNPLVINGMIPLLKNPRKTTKDLCLDLLCGTFAHDLLQQYLSRGLLQAEMFIDQAKDKSLILLLGLFYSRVPKEPEMLIACGVPVISKFESYVSPAQEQQIVSTLAFVHNSKNWSGVNIEEKILVPLQRLKQSLRSSSATTSYEDTLRTWEDLGLVCSPADSDDSMDVSGSSSVFIHPLLTTLLRSKLCEESSRLGLSETGEWPPRQYQKVFMGYILFLLHTAETSYMCSYSAGTMRLLQHEWFNLTCSIFYSMDWMDRWSRAASPVRGPLSVISRFELDALEAFVKNCALYAVYGILDKNVEFAPFVFERVVGFALNFDITRFDRSSLGDLDDTNSILSGVFLLLTVQRAESLAIKAAIGASKFYMARLDYVNFTKYMDFLAARLGLENSLEVDWLEFQLLEAKRKAVFQKRREEAIQIWNNIEHVITSQEGSIDNYSLQGLLWDALHDHIIVLEELSPASADLLNLRRRWTECCAANRRLSAPGDVRFIGSGSRVIPALDVSSSEEYANVSWDVSSPGVPEHLREYFIHLSQSTQRGESVITKLTDEVDWLMAARPVNWSIAVQKRTELAFQLFRQGQRVDAIDQLNAVCQIFAELSDLKNEEVMKDIHSYVYFLRGTCHSMNGHNHLVAAAEDFLKCLKSTSSTDSWSLCLMRLDSICYLISISTETDIACSEPLWSLCIQFLDAVSSPRAVKCRISMREIGFSEVWELEKKEAEYYVHPWKLGSAISLHLAISGNMRLARYEGIRGFAEEGEISKTEPPDTGVYFFRITQALMRSEGPEHNAIIASLAQHIVDRLCISLEDAITITTHFFAIILALSGLIPKPRWRDESKKLMRDAELVLFGNERLLESGPPLTYFASTPMGSHGMKGFFDDNIRDGSQYLTVWDTPYVRNLLLEYISCHPGEERCLRFSRRHFRNCEPIDTEDIAILITDTRGLRRLQEGNANLGVELSQAEAKAQEESEAHQQGERIQKPFEAAQSEINRLRENQDQTKQRHGTVLTRVVSRLFRGKGRQLS